MAYPLPDGRILVGGGFKVANGVLKLNLARLNADGTLDNSFNAVITSSSLLGSAVRCVAVQPDGKILIGGTFNRVNNVVAGNIARLNADGTLDATLNTGTGFNSTVTAVTLQADGKILVGGDYTAYNGNNRSYLVRLNADGSLDSSFTTAISSFFSNAIRTILPLPDGKFFIQGAFSGVNSLTRRGLAKLNADGSVDASFVEPGTYSLYNLMRSFAVRPDGKIYIGGAFEIRVSNQLVCQNLCRLNANGTLDTSYFVAFPSNSSVNTMYLEPDGHLLVHGFFNTINGTARNGVARVNDDGSINPSFNPLLSPSDGVINAFVPLPDGHYLLPGIFSGVNGTSAENLAKIDAAGNADASFTPSFSLLTKVVTASIIQPDGKMLAAGDFNRANGTLRSRIARFNSDGTLDTSFNAAITNGQPGTPSFEDVNKLVLQPDGKILLGGTFAQINGEAHRYLARLNSDGSVDSSFNPLLTYEGSGSGSVYSMALQADGAVIIGGAFQTVNGVARVRYARLNANGTLDSSFVIPFDSAYTPLIYAIMVQPDGKILLGGDFKFTGNSTALSLARLNSDGSLDASFTPPPVAATPYAIRSFAKQPDGKILVGGSYDSLGTKRPLLIRINPGGSLDATFTSDTLLDTFVGDKIVSIIIQPNGKLLLGGAFSLLTSSQRAVAARLLENGGLDYSFNAPPFSIENTLDQASLASLNQAADGKLIAAGNFDRVGNNFASGLVRLQASNPPLFDFDGDGKTDPSVFRPANGTWYVLGSTAGFSATQFGAGGDKIVPGDYDGDGKTDVAVFRPSTGYWYLLRSSNNSFSSQLFGQAEDIPAAADYDGDGKTDLAVYRPSNNHFYLLYSSDNSFHFQQWGATGDLPLTGDYDGDGKTDFAIFRPSIGTFYVLRSSDGGVIGQQFGASGDRPVAADFDGDAKTDIAVYRPNTGAWYYLQSRDGSFSGVAWGASGDVPVAGDYDSDGKWDVAVFRPSTGTFYILQSTTNALRADQFGANGDVPVPSAYVQ